MSPKAIMVPATVCVWSDFFPIQKSRFKIWQAPVHLWRPQGGELSAKMTTHSLIWLEFNYILIHTRQWGNSNEQHWCGLCHQADQRLNRPWGIQENCLIRVSATDADEFRSSGSTYILNFSSFSRPESYIPPWSLPQDLRKSQDFSPAHQAHPPTISPTPRINKTFSTIKHTLKKWPIYHFPKWKIN